VHLLPARVAQSLLGHRQQSAGPVEGVTLAATVPEHLVLDPAPGLVHPLVGQLDDVELVGHLGGAGQAGVEDRLVGTGEIRLYATNWGERVLILGGDGFLGQVTPPAWSSTRSR